MQLPFSRSETCARVAITVEFLALVRTLFEFFRLEHVEALRFTVATGRPYVIGALIAAIFCWASVTFYFFRRYRLVIVLALLMVASLLVVKFTLIG